MPDIIAPAKNRWVVVGRHIFTSLSTILLCFALAWGIAKPHAQSFIRDTIKEENFASKSQLDTIVEKLATLETRVGSVENSQREQKNAQTRLETSLNSVEDLQREQRADIKAILLNVRKLNN